MALRQVQVTPEGRTLERFFAWGSWDDWHDVSKSAQVPQVPRLESGWRENKTEYQRRYMWRRYGVADVAKAQVLWDGSNVCAICGRAVSGRRKVLDHDHTTGQPRGILCRKCNLVMGLAGDDSVLLRFMAEYLDTKK